MATVDNTLGGNTAIDGRFSNRTYIMERYVDLAEAAARLNSGDDFTTGDIMQLFDIPAWCVVRNAWVRVHEAEGAACTIDIGITGDDADGLINDADLNTTTFGSTHETGVALGYGANNYQGKMVATADTVDIYFNSADSGAAKFTVYLEVLDLSQHDYSA